MLKVPNVRRNSSAIAQEEPVATRNGDVNGDGGRDISDAIYLLSWLFQGGSVPVAIAQEVGELTPCSQRILRDLKSLESTVSLRNIALTRSWCSSELVLAATYPALR